MRIVLFVAVVTLGGGLAVAEPHRKPTAPVDVRLDAKLDAAHGGYQVTLTATPARDVAGMDLRIGGQQLGLEKSIHVGATTAGTHREFTVLVPVAKGAGVDVIGAARIATGEGSRNRVTSLRVGAAAPVTKPAPSTVRTLPDGQQVLEVR